jgi:hypothetical protein
MVKDLPSFTKRFSGFDRIVAKDDKNSSPQPSASVVSDFDGKMTSYWQRSKFRCNWSSN